MKNKLRNAVLCTGALAFLLLTTVLVRAALQDRWWTVAVQGRVEEAGTNSMELVKALTGVAVARREGLAFLVENMPPADLDSLSAAFLLENIDLAYEAWDKSRWRDRVGKELFFNDVLPYACLNEARDGWRKKLHTVCAPIVAECKRPGEAAHLLNQKIFSLLNVRYSTGRRRPHQSPIETMSSGMATCTGLSILLVDACRSVGIPARVAGTPNWSNERGNHTWVEVWDGDWHFAGAAEPDGAGLDRGWFVQDAAQAQPDVPEHAIYATSFRRTGITFPLVWAPSNKSVNAINVTDRYAAKASPANEGKVRLAVKVVRADGKRIIADLLIADTGDPSAVLTDKSRGETVDMNDLATFNLTPSHKYRVVASLEGSKAESEITVTEAADQLATLTLPDRPQALAAVLDLRHNYRPLNAKDTMRLKAAVTDYFTAEPSRRASWTFPQNLEKLLRQQEPAARDAVWEAYRTAPIHGNLKADFDAHVVKSGGYQSPYSVKTVGQRPPGGWALFIALHGGGNAPKEINDRQWKHMQVYYREHPEGGGYLYLALRAPNDEWNGFYADYVYPLIDTLIRQFRLFGDIDPDKVFLMGYSHGGYGSYAIGPKMPDRFAAIHASAAAATDGETTARTLRTTPFTAMVGENDTMYGRYVRNVRFKDEVERLRVGRADIYPVKITIVPGNGHTGLPDRDKIADMYPAVRNPVPRELDWFMTDGVLQDFFWLRVPKPSKRQEILASCLDNRFVITTSEDVTDVTVLTDTRLVDFRRPVYIEVNGILTKRRIEPRLKTLCETLARRADPGFAFSAELSLSRETATSLLTVRPAPK